MKKKFLHLSFLISFFFLLSTDSFARFGGGGGGGGYSGGGGGYSGGGGGGYGGGGYHGGGSYGSGGHWSGSGGNAGEAGWALLMLLGVVIIGAIIKYKLEESTEWDDASSYYSSLPKTKIGFMSSFDKNQKLAQIKDFNEPAFLEKVKTAFQSVQDSWKNKNISVSRRFISDGMYQRVNTQLLMMDKLGQTNYIEVVNLVSKAIVYVEKKEPFDMLYVEVKAFIKEQYTHPKFKGLNQYYSENFTEYWVFIRKANSKTADLYANTSCPNCGNALPENLGEVSKCVSCGAYTNTGEFDWVLSEVIQTDEFTAMMEAKKYHSTVQATIRNMQHVFVDINIPVLEDKASNAYLQVKMAMALGDMHRIKRFSTDAFVEATGAKLQTPFLYNRFYLRKVSLINVYDTTTHYLAAFNVKYTAQRVRIEGERCVMLENSMISSEENLVLAIRKENKTSAHSVFSYNCTQCGGALNDTIDITCPYCHSVLNDDSRDWIVYGLYNYYEFTQFKAGFNTSPRVQIAVEKKLSGGNQQLRDYALNNMMVILNADGQLNTEEKKFALRVTKLLGYKREEISLLWEQGSTHKMGIQMPDDKKKQQKIYKLMKKAAQSDKLITVAEQEVLRDVREKYSLVD